MTENIVRPGMRFRVTGIKEVRDSGGRLLARYHPSHPETGEPLDYGVTPRNVKIVNQMIAEGAAVAETAGEARKAAGIASGRATLKGTAATGAVPTTKGKTK